MIEVFSNGAKVIRAVSFSLVLMAAATFPSACSQSIGSPSSNSESGAITLTGTVWKLQSFQRSDSTTVQVSNPDQFTMEFGADGRMGVRADCNRCAALYSQAGDTLTVHPAMACTRAACWSTPFDSEYVTAVADTTMVRASGNTLECISTHGVLTFTR